MVKQEGQNQDPSGKMAKIEKDKACKSLGVKSLESFFKRTGSQDSMENDCNIRPLAKFDTSPLNLKNGLQCQTKRLVGDPYAGEI
jgi:hypothetical protein